MSPWDKPNEKLVKLLDETVANLEFDKPVDYIGTKTISTHQPDLLRSW